MYIIDSVSFRHENLMDLATVNRLDHAAFVTALGTVFENSPWVAEQAWHARSFPSVAALHGAMVTAVKSAPRAQQLVLLRAHPELAGKEARTGMMTDASKAEQSSAGLNQLTRDEVERISQLNTEYRSKFGHPFIIAARNHTKQDIFAAFEQRLNNSADAEREAALTEVFAITQLRLDVMFAPAAQRVGT